MMPLTVRSVKITCIYKKFPSASGEPMITREAKIRTVASRRKIIKRIPAVFPDFTVTRLLNALSYLVLTETRFRGCLGSHFSVMAVKHGSRLFENGCLTLTPQPRTVGLPCFSTNQSISLRAMLIFPGKWGGRLSALNQFASLISFSSVLI